MSSFEQTMIGLSPQCYIPSFMKIGLLVREKIFKGFYLIWHGGHTDHVTKLILINFHFLVPKNFDMKFGYKSPRSFWEKQV